MTGPPQFDLFGDPIPDEPEPEPDDTEALRMAGNGVVRQQAAAALRLMLNRMETHGRAETRSHCPCQKRDQP